MGIQRLLAAACAVAGVGVLAGLGWALLTAAVLLFAVPSADGLHTAVRRVRSVAAAIWRWLATGRQAVAAASMPAAILALALGIGLALGPGWGLAAAGVVIGGLALRIDGTE